MKKSETQRVALVTGGNRGIGLETCRQLAAQGVKVLLGARNRKAGEKAAADLRKQGLDVDPIVLDVTKPATIRAAARTVKSRYKRLDILVNNAGVFLDPSPDKGSALSAKTGVVLKTFETNTLGPMETIQAFAPLMKKGGYGRIVNVSSGMGQLSEMDGWAPGYRLSKTALNAVTRVFASELKDEGILVNSVCPGWVKTRMGGDGAERPVEKGAETLVWLATLPASGPTGGFFRDKKRIPW